MPCCLTTHGTHGVAAGVAVGAAAEAEAEEARAEACRPLRLSRFVKNTKPRSSKPFNSTIRADGRPSASAVAMVIAFGFGRLEVEMAWSNQLLNTENGLTGG